MTDDNYVDIRLDALGRHVVERALRLLIGGTETLSVWETDSASVLLEAVKPRR